MSNNAGINVFKRKNILTKEVDYSLEICDDYGSTSIEVQEKDVMVEPLELLQLIAKQQRYDDFHGRDSCDIIKQIFYYIVENQKGISIGSKPYSWEMIKDTVRFEFSNPFALYFVDDNPNDADYNEENTKKAKKISKQLIVMFDKLVADIGTLQNIENMDECKKIMLPVSKKILGLQKKERIRIGLSDTYTCERICICLERDLIRHTDHPVAKKISNTFFQMIY